jgi:DNA-binding LacI/PurR family transcriptional regulator
MSTVKDIAKIAGVSLGTVSHVLNGTLGVREPIRRRVLEADRSTTYQPSQLVRGLRRVPTNVIGMMIPDITSPFFPAVVRGAEDQAFSNGDRLILCNADNNHSKQLAHLNRLRTYLAAGLIVIPSTFSDLTIQAESYRQSPTVRWARESHASTVSPRTGPATRSLPTIRKARTKRPASDRIGPDAARHCHRPLTPDQRTRTAQRIQASPRRGQASARSRVRAASNLRQTRRRVKGGAAFAAHSAAHRDSRWQRHDPLGVLAAIREAGLRCPQDVSLFGFDDLELAETTNPALCSVSQSGYQLGSTAASILLERMQGYSGPARHVVLETSLKLRDSIAPPASDIPVRRAAAGKHRSTPP